MEAFWTERERERDAVEHTPSETSPTHSEKALEPPAPSCPMPVALGFMRPALDIPAPFSRGSLKRSFTTAACRGSRQGCECLGKQRGARKGGGASDHHITCPTKAFACTPSPLTLSSTSAFLLFDVLMSLTSSVSPNLLLPSGLRSASFRFNSEPSIILTCGINSVLRIPLSTFEPNRGR